MNNLSYNVVVDDAAPKLVIAPGVLTTTPPINSMRSPSPSASAMTPMPPTGLTMRSVMYRLGNPVEGSQQTFVLPVAETLNEFTIYNGTVNFSPAA